MERELSRISCSASQPGMLIKPLLHEMCHAAAFVFNRETGHGDNCRRWWDPDLGCTIYKYSDT